MLGLREALADSVGSVDAYPCVEVALEILPLFALSYTGLRGSLWLEDVTVSPLENLPVLELVLEEVRDSCSRRSPWRTNCRMDSWLSPSRILWNMESASASGRVRRRS